MLELSDAQIGGWVGTFLLPLFRIAAVFMTMPIIGTNMVPARVKLYMALAFTALLVPTLPPMPQVDAVSVQALPLIAEQILIGALMGFSLQLFFHVFVIAGQLLSTQAGLSFASMVDPANGISVPVLGQFFNVLVTLLFLSMNGHLIVMEILAESFTTLPVGQLLSVDHFWELAGKLSWVLGAGVLLVLPAITALLVVNLAFGVMTRSASTQHFFHWHALNRNAGSGHYLDWYSGYLFALRIISHRSAAMAPRAGASAIGRRSPCRTNPAVKTVQRSPPTNVSGRRARRGSYPDPVSLAR